MSIILIVHLKVKEGKEIEMEAVFRKIAEVSLKGAGCLSFKVIRSRGNNKGFMFLEEYTTIDVALENQRSIHYNYPIIDQILPNLTSRNIYLMEGLI